MDDLNKNLERIKNYAEIFIDRLECDDVYEEIIDATVEITEQFHELQKENKSLQAQIQNWKTSFEGVSLEVGRLREQLVQASMGINELQSLKQKIDNYYGLMVQANQNYQDLLHQNEVLEKSLDHVCRFISDSRSGIIRYDEIEIGKYLRTLSDCVDSNKELIIMFKVLYKALYLATLDYNNIESGSKDHQRIIKQYIDCAAEIVTK